MQETETRPVFHSCVVALAADYNGNEAAHLLLRKLGHFGGGWGGHLEPVREPPLGTSAGDAVGLSQASCRRWRVPSLAATPSPWSGFLCTDITVSSQGFLRSVQLYTTGRGGRFISLPALFKGSSVLRD